MRTTPDVTDAAALTLVQAVADKFFDGHVTLLKFTTNWRVSLGSNLAFGEHHGETLDRIRAIPQGATLLEAVIEAINATPDAAVRAFRNALADVLEAQAKKKVDPGCQS